MTVSTTVARVSYAGDGVSTDFATTYTFLEETDLVVVLRAASGVETTQALTTDYTVAGGDGMSGTVSMTVPPASGETLVILRSLPLTQETDYTNQDPFDAETHERALDRAAMRDQQLAEALGRAVTTPVSSGLGDIELPEPGAGELLRWNAAGTALETTAFGALTSTEFDYTPGGLADNDLLVYETGTGAWTNKTPAEVRGVLALGDLSLKSAVATADLEDDAVTLAKLEHGTQGELLYYEASGVPARLSTGTAGQILQTQGAGANPQWTAGPAFTETFESAEIALVSQSTDTVAHGLSGPPLLAMAYLRCKTAEYGYSVGDEITQSQDTNQYESGGWNWHNISIALGAAHVRYVMAYHGFLIFRADAGNIGREVAPTTANWRLVLRAWR